MARLPLPPARPVVHPMRNLTSAVTTLRDLPGHRRRMTIDHQPLTGVTPEMLRWWFSSIGGDMVCAGDRVPKYLVWHPLDHIHWELARPAPDGGVGEGSRFRIVEAFQRRSEFYVDTTDIVEKLDGTGIRLVRRIAGVLVLQLEHTWSRGDGRTHYVSVLDIGARARCYRPINWYLNQHVFPVEMARAWLRHNVEEVGLLEHFLPELHAERHGRTVAPVPEARGCR